MIFASPLIYFWVIKPFVDARDEAVAKVTLLAHYDPLTQIANRRLIYQNLEKLMARCARRKIYGALLLIDLNNFKALNDNHGHDAGDTILVEVAKRLTSAMRKEDVVGRIGGDEFLVLIDQLDSNEQLAHEKVLTITNKLHAVVNTPLEHKGKILQVGSSIGICLLVTENVSMDTVIKRADVAMYQAKKSAVKHVIYSEK